MTQGRADTVGGRVIRQRIDVTMRSPDCEPVGGTQAASALGQELSSAAITGLRAAAEAEGFAVSIEFNQVVY